MSGPSSRLEVYTVAVSDKTTWILLRLFGAHGIDGAGEATLNGRTEEVLAAAEAACGIASATAAGLAGKLDAVRTGLPGILGRALASGLEQAHLDREGKATGRPVHALLGGCRRRRVACYANINRGTLSRTPEEFALRAVEAVDQGYPAVKLAPFDGVRPDAGRGDARRGLIEAGLQRIAAVVRSLGDRAAVQVDCHSRFRPEEAGWLLDEVAARGVAWLEEPVPETADALAALAALRVRARSAGVTLAGAENAADLAAVLPFLVRGCYDVVMPDIVLAGGPREAVAIAQAAAAHGALTSLHNPCGPVMDMMSAQVASVIPALLSLERQVAESPLYDEIVLRSNRFQDGAIVMSDAPGGGFTVDWRHPALRLAVSASVAL